MSSLRTAARGAAGVFLRNASTRSTALTAAKAAVAGAKGGPTDSLARRDILSGQAPEREFRDTALDGAAPFAYNGVEFDIAQEDASPKRQWPTAPEFPTDDEQSRQFQESLRELLDGYDVGAFGEERFNLWAAKNPHLRPSFARRARTLGDAALVKVGKYLDRHDFETAAKEFAELDAAKRPSDALWFWETLVEAYLYKQDLMTAVSQATGSSDKQVAFQPKAYMSVMESCFAILPPATPACPDDAFLAVVKPLYTSSELLPFLERQIKAGHMSSLLCQRIFEAEFNTHFAIISHSWDVAVEQHAKNLAGIKAAAGSEAALADTRTKAEKKALELEALLKKQAKLTGMPPTPGQLESMGLLGYIVGGGNGLDLINRVLKECIEQGVPLPENLLVVGHATAKQLSIATASAFVTSVSKALTDKKASLANISAPLALNWATLQVQYSDAKHATQLTKDLLSNERYETHVVLEMLYKVVTLRLPAVASVAQERGITLRNWLDVAFNAEEAIPESLMELMKAYAASTSADDLKHYVELLCEVYNFLPPLSAVRKALAAAPAATRTAVVKHVEGLIESRLDTFAPSVKEALLA